MTSRDDGLVATLRCMAERESVEVEWALLRWHPKLGPEPVLQDGLSEDDVREWLATAPPDEKVSVKRRERRTTVVVTDWESVDLR